MIFTCLLTALAVGITVANNTTVQVGIEDWEFSWGPALIVFGLLGFFASYRSSRRAEAS